MVGSIFTIGFQGRDEGLKRQVMSVAAVVEDFRKRILALNTSLTSAAASSGQFGQAVRTGTQGVKLLNASLRAAQTDAKLFQLTYGENAEAIAALQPLLRTAEKDFQSLAGGQLKSASAASTMAANMELLAAQLPETAMSTDMQAVETEELRLALERTGAELREFAAEHIRLAEAQKVQTTQTQEANKHMRLLGLNRGPEATKALNITSSAAAGTMLGMGALSGSLMQVGFSLIFLKFSMVPIAALFAGLTLGVTLLGRRLNDMIVKGRTLENFSGQMGVLGIKSNVVGMNLVTVARAVSEFDNSIADSPEHLSDFTSAFSVLAAQGLSPTKDELVTIGRIAFATGQTVEEVAKSMLEAADPKAIALTDAEGFRGVLDSLIPVSKRGGDALEALVHDMNLFANIAADPAPDRFSKLLTHITGQWEELGDVTKPFLDPHEGGPMKWLADLKALIFGDEASPEQAIFNIVRALDALSDAGAEDPSKALMELLQLEADLPSGISAGERDKRKRAFLSEVLGIADEDTLNQVLREVTNQLKKGFTRFGRLDVDAALDAVREYIVTHELPELKLKIDSEATLFDLAMKNPLFQAWLAQHPLLMSLNLEDPAVQSQLITEFQGWLDTSILKGTIDIKDPEVFRNFMSDEQLWLDEDVNKLLGTFDVRDRQLIQTLREEWQSHLDANPGSYTVYVRYSDPGPSSRTQTLSPEDMNPDLTDPFAPDNVVLRARQNRIANLRRTLGPGGSGIDMDAEGGIVTRPRLSVTGEAGPEAIIPLDRLHEFLRPMVPMGESVGAAVNITIEANGATFLDEEAPQQLVDAVSDSIARQLDVRRMITVNRR